MLQERRSAFKNEMMLQRVFNRVPGPEETSGIYCGASAVSALSLGERMSNFRKQLHLGRREDPKHTTND